MANETNVSPTVCAYPDEQNENVFVDIELPGVDKDNISLKINDDSFTIEATKEGVRYVGYYVFCCPVDPDKATAKYTNGLLTVTAPYKQAMAAAKEIAIT
ncbi:MAG: Hsp20/alpha crystallin family protein [Methanobacteriota archaeon]|nr:MAG: Hsp20/alpha crystallin family protein [Euryarchaeota archaeon]